MLSCDLILVIVYFVLFSADISYGAQLTACGLCLCFMHERKNPEV